MAYLSNEVIKAVREEIKKKYPTKKGWKFSITNDNHSSMNVSIMKAPMKFTDKDYDQLNHYYLENYENSEVLKEISKICNRTNFNKSDSMTDYFHVGFYFHLEVGKWNKPFELTK